MSCQLSHSLPIICTGKGLSFTPIEDTICEKQIILVLTIKENLNILTLFVFLKYCAFKSVLCFLLILWESIKCSGWAIVTGLCTSSVVHAWVCVLALTFFVQTTSSLEPLMGIWPISTGMVLGWSSTKIVQMVLIGCISRSRGQKIGF